MVAAVAFGVIVGALGRIPQPVDFRQDGFKRSAGAGSLYKTGKIGKAQGFFQFFPYPFGGKVGKLSFRRHPGNQFKRFRRRSKIKLGGKPAKAENP